MNQIEATQQVLFTPVNVRSGARALPKHTRALAVEWVRVNVARRDWPDWAIESSFVDVPASNQGV